MGSAFYENPLIEGQLAFVFAIGTGATRYEVWPSHVHGFQQLGKKAVDFIYPAEESRELFFTEVKDFTKITREGKYKKGDYGLALAEDIAKKFADSFSGYAEVLQATQNEEERAFASSTQAYLKTAVFHWEFQPEFPRQKRLHDMKTMKAKLRELLNGICSRIRIESMDDYPSTTWIVTRIGE